MNLLRLCDMHNIPVATNIATAEVLIHGLERGDLDWRNILRDRAGSFPANFGAAQAAPSCERDFPRCKTRGDKL